MQSSNPDLVLRPPTADDGPALTDLVDRCPPLDPNSRYCNLLQCSHFADTAVVAELNGKMVGAVTGYRPPRQPNVLFIWQVAVAEEARGLKLAKRMIVDILRRKTDAPLTTLETTITPDNEASWGLFTSIANYLNAPLEKSVMFEKQRHFAGKHDDEMLCHIGPFSTLHLTEARHENL